MQVKEINIGTGKFKGYRICNKKSMNSHLRWSYQSDLVYIIEEVLGSNLYKLLTISSTFTNFLVLYFNLTTFTL